MTHHQYLFIGFLHAVLQAVIIIPICIMGFIALNIAFRNRQKLIVSWLMPILIGHMVVAVYDFYSLSFYVFRWKASPTSTFVIYGLGVIGLFIGLYTAWRILKYVLACSSFSVSDQEGVWPPPPTDKI